MKHDICQGRSARRNTLRKKRRVGIAARGGRDALLVVLRKHCILLWYCVTLPTWSRLMFWRNYRAVFVDVPMLVDCWLLVHISFWGDTA